jgi:hypothetical protein
MAGVIGKSMQVPLGRRIVYDFLHASMSVPTVAIQKNMNVAELFSARQRARVRPSWMSIFTKAYAKTAAATPELRQVFLTFPWQRMFEYARPTADIVIEASVNGAPTLVTVPLQAPDTMPLLAMDQHLVACKEKPVERVRQFQRAMFLARFPALLRRWVWWYILNASGPKRARYFSTFGVTSVGNWGVDSLRPLAPWTSLLHFGAIGADGVITMRLTYDHRVLDGSAPSKALIEMERILQTEILAELRSLGETPDQRTLWSSWADTVQVGISEPS